jgi:nitrogen-specific signal transduction histidine kinase
MNSATAPILAALIVQLCLGLTVFQANPRRKSNQCFLLLCLAICVWLAAFYFGFRAQNEFVARISIRAASVAGVLIITSFNLLRLSIREGQQGWHAILRHSRVWLLVSFGIIVLCQTNLFLQGGRMPPVIGTGAPTPIYGSGGWVYGLYFVGGLLSIFVGAARDMRKAKGGERTELAFILIGGVSTVAFALLLAYALDFLVGPSKSILIAPFRAFIFTLVIAYGIATRKIMEVGVFLRRLMSYILLTLYLLALYALIWWLVDTVLHSTLADNARSIAHVAAAIVVAFAMAPARGVSRRLAERLFISSHHLDFRATVSKAAEILSSVTTLHDLLHRFANTIAEAVGAERVLILLHGRDGYTTRYALTRSTEAQPGYQLPLDGPVAAYLMAHREPAVVDELHRIRQTPEVLGLVNRMRGMKIAVAMGIFSREHLAGIMLLGPRTSGRIYGGAEQNALQVLCGQLAIAIENAQLFTEVQNAKIYNETLLENLTTGVIAAGIDQRVTVFNNEAGQITKVDAKDVLDQTIDRLPLTLYHALGETLRTGKGRENSELLLGMGAEAVTVRASTSIFHGQEGEPLGALMVLTDITALKRLELQIRRSDRLASLGTLSAGMAHEIKNPLVSIKTFAQLLPERYQDSDFRETFSNLIGHEIDRIDSLVNQLLRFARPTKPHLVPMHVHEILEKSLLLVGHRLYQKDIKLTRSWEANVDTIRADADQLEQVFLNFFINAMDAMKNGGELNISTQIRTDEEWISPLTQSNGEAYEILRVTIRDSGEGISREDLPHVFDPFFTTKDYGTGLGLSVVHGIIQEHGGQIEVESELQKGTAFHILLPLVRFDSKVAAA